MFGSCSIPTKTACHIVLHHVNVSSTQAQNNKFVPLCKSPPEFATLLLSGAFNLDQKILGNNDTLTEIQQKFQRGVGAPK